MKFSALVVPAILCIGLAACASKEKPKEATAPEPLKVEETAQISVTSKVKAVNVSTRRITLADAYGHEETYIVDKAVQRLNEVKVGDDVTATCTVTLLGELRPPTQDETAHPISSVAYTNRAPNSAEPSASSTRATRVVTTVQKVDLPNMLVTLKGPMGDMVTFRAKRPDRVKQLHVGDTIVITYTEAVAISLDKVAPR